MSPLNDSPPSSRRGRHPRMLSKRRTNVCPNFENKVNQDRYVFVAELGRHRNMYGKRVTPSGRQKHGLQSQCCNSATFTSGDEQTNNFTCDVPSNDGHDNKTDVKFNSKSTESRINSISTCICVNARTHTERVLLRPWLIEQLNSGKIPNVVWHDDKKTMIRIPWVHGSRHTHGPQHSELFRAWAEHTGRLDPKKKPLPKKWKANFRCALNSLHAQGVHEVPRLRKKGQHAYKVYTLGNESSKRPTLSTSRRGRPKRQQGTTSIADQKMSQSRQSSKAPKTKTKQLIRSRLDNMIRREPICAAASVRTLEADQQTPRNENNECAATVDTPGHRGTAQHHAECMPRQTTEIPVTVELMFDDTSSNQGRHSDALSNDERHYDASSNDEHHYDASSNDERHYDASSNDERHYYGYRNHVIEQQVADPLRDQFEYSENTISSPETSEDGQISSPSPIYVVANQNTTYTEADYHQVLSDLMMKRTEHEFFYEIASVAGDAPSSGYLSDASSTDQSSNGSSSFTTLQPVQTMCVTDTEARSPF